MHQTEGLHSQDISLVLKHFSYTIQQRFQQIDKSHNFFTCLNSNNFDKSEIESKIISKYWDYKAKNSKQIKLCEKFAQRIIQVFQYFRQKCDKADELIQIQQNITVRIKSIIKSQTTFKYVYNNRPKTQKSYNNRQYENRSAAQINDLSNQKQQKNILDSHNIINCSKKIKTENEQKQIHVGQLFKYAFSILKKGYLIKLKMQEKRNTKANKLKNDLLKQKINPEQNNYISIQGTGAVLRSYSEKSKKNGNQEIGQFLRKQIKDKLQYLIKSNSNNDHNILSNKKQQYFGKKMKSISISSNYESMNCSILQKGKIRQIDRCLRHLYDDCMDIDKYFIMKSLKQQDIWVKDMIRRNSDIIKEGNKFQAKCKSKNVEDYVHIGQQSSEFNEEIQQNTDFILSKRSSSAVIKKQNNFFEPYPCQFTEQTQFQEENLEKSFELDTLQIKMPQESPMMTQISEFDAFESADPILKVQSSFGQKPVLTEKIQNQAQIVCNKDIFSKQKQLKRHQQLFKINLTNMLEEKPSSKKSSRQTVYRSEKATLKNSGQKKYPYFQNCDSDNFIPLGPRRDRKILQQISENATVTNPNTLSQFCIKKKNFFVNYHPLNRCRVYREKKDPKKKSIIPNQIVFLANQFRQSSFAQENMKNSIY